MRSQWAMRGFLLAVLVVIMLRYILANTVPMLDHMEFDLSRRQRAVATTFADRGGRFCCGDGDCRMMKSQLGVFSPIVLCTDRKRTPQCGVGDGLLLNGEFIDGPLRLRDLEKLINQSS